jgi:hypothetical protein
VSYVPVKRGSTLALWQHGQLGRGFGAYESVGDWTWELNPFAFSWLAPGDSTPQPAPIISGFSGLGGCGCGGSCGGCGSHSHGVSGLGQGLLNTGLFASTDVSTWGIGEWSILAIAALGAVNILGGIAGAGKSTAKAYSGYKRRKKKRLQAQASMF